MTYAYCSLSRDSKTAILIHLKSYKLYILYVAEHAKLTLTWLKLSRISGDNGISTLNSMQ